MNKTTRIGTGEALRRLGQIAIDYTEASRDVYSAKNLLDKAKANWAKVNNCAELPEQATPEWRQMMDAVSLEFEHFQRAKTRRSYAQAMMMKRAGLLLGMPEKKEDDEILAPKKLALLDLRVQMTDAKQQKALDKRRLSLAMAECGIPRSVRNQVCRGYFGPVADAELD